MLKVILDLPYISVAFVSMLKFIAGRILNCLTLKY